MTATVRLKKGKETAIREGFPWIYAGDLVDSSEPLLLPPGSLVAIETQKGEFVGTGYFNAKSQIACRVLTLKKEPIDDNFFRARFENALARRKMEVPYYRLVHSESDFLPGLLIDRFGEALVIQVSTAGMENLQPVWLPALEKLLQPKTIILRGDIPARGMEGLKQEVITINHQPSTDFVEVHENGCIYFADLLRGQKTGWFFDQRDNRRMIAELAKGKTLLDVYSHSGGFGILAALCGATVTMVDSSKLALELANKAAEKNGVAARCSYLQGDAFELMQKLAKEGRRYDIVLADPPAFVKSKKDIASGLKGYEKVARLAAGLVADGGHLFVASCSHHASRGSFNNAVIAGVEKAGRSAEIVKQTGAGPDHPRHAKLPQSEYLKGLLLKIK